MPLISIILKGPKYFSESFLLSRFKRRFFVDNKTRFFKGLRQVFFIIIIFLLFLRFILIFV